MCEESVQLNGFCLQGEGWDKVGEKEQQEQEEQEQEQKKQLISYSYGYKHIFRRY